jgi:hypothetical protein
MFLFGCSNLIQVRTVQHYKNFSVVEYKGNGYVLDTVLHTSLTLIPKRCLKGQ